MQLRRQVGTLRFDLDNIAESNGSGSAENKALYQSIEKLDLALLKKNADKITTAYAGVLAAVNAVSV